MSGAELRFSFSSAPDSDVNCVQKQNTVVQSLNSVYILDTNVNCVQKYRHSRLVSELNIYILDTAVNCVQKHRHISLVSRLSVYTSIQDTYVINCPKNIDTAV